MIYELILNNEVIKTKDFTETPPTLSSNKGKWLQRVDIPATEEPTSLQKIETNHIITDTESRWEQEIVNKFQDIPDGLTKEEQEANYLQTLKQQKYTELTAKAKHVLTSAMSDYSEWEAISWPMLIAEAKQYELDETVGPYMEAEIGVKYPTASDLAAIILQRETAMKQLRAMVVLVRQQKEIAINSAETLDAVKAIDIDDGWE